MNHAGRCSPQAQLSDDSNIGTARRSSDRGLFDIEKIANTNAPLGMTSDGIRPRVQSFFGNVATYGQVHAQQIDGFKSLAPTELGWVSITHSEARVVSTLQYLDQSSQNLIRGGDAELGRHSLTQAITRAHDAGRLTLSEPGIRHVEQTLGEAAATPLRVPPGQRGYIAPELLVGELSPGRVLGGMGLLASAADTVATGQRMAQRYRQDSPLAAHSELAHFAGRNAGGWAGGASVAYALGTTAGAGPMALIAADAYFLSRAGEKAADWWDNRTIYRQTDSQGVNWTFDGRAWTRPGMADLPQDGSDNPTRVSIAASAEKARELDYRATNAAVELAIHAAPSPQDPYRLPANDSDRPSLAGNAGQA